MSIEPYRIYILALIALLLILAVSWYSWQQLQRNRHQQHLHAVISKLGLARLRDVVLPDGLDGLVFIDYLLLTPNGIVVVDIMHTEGHIFGGDAIDQWSQVINHRTYKFSNPLYANQNKCQAVAWNIKNLDQNDASLDTGTKQIAELEIQGWVSFSNAGNFPKGIPPQVCMIDDLGDILAEQLREPSTARPELHQLWDRLHDLSVTTRAALPHSHPSRH